MPSDSGSLNSLVKTSSGILPRSGSRYLQLGRRRQARRGELGIAEERDVALVHPVEEILVGPGEVEHRGDRLAHAAVLEDVAPDVEGEALHAGRQLVRDLSLLDAAVLHRRDVVGGRPVARDVLLADVDLAGLEGLELHGDVAIVLVAHDLEIVAAAIHPEVLGPPVVDPAVGDGAADVEGIDLVGAAAERDLERHLLEVARRPPFGRQHRKLADDQRQLLVGVVAEGEQHLAVAGLLGLQHVMVVEGVVGRALGLQGVEGEDHVLDGDRRAVVEPGLRPEREGDPRAVVGPFDGLGDQAVLGRRPRRATTSRACPRSR